MGRPERTQKFEQEVAALELQHQGRAIRGSIPSAFAFGVEYRREEISGYVAPEYQDGWIVGNFLPTFGDYTVREAYLETLVSLPWKPGVQRRGSRHRLQHLWFRDDLEGGPRLVADLGPAFASDAVA